MALAPIISVDQSAFDGWCGYCAGQLLFPRTIYQVSNLNWVDLGAHFVILLRCEIGPKITRPTDERSSHYTTTAPCVYKVMWLACLLIFSSIKIVKMTHCTFDEAKLTHSVMLSSSCALLNGIGIHSIHRFCPGCSGYCQQFLMMIW